MIVVAPGRNGDLLCLSKREDLFIKDNMSRGDNTVRCDVVATVATMIRGVVDEDTECGAVVELVVRGGCEVGEAATPEHTKLVVGRVNAEEESKRCCGAGGAACSAVEEVCRCGQCLCPERQGS